MRTTAPLDEPMTLPAFRCVGCLADIIEGVREARSASTQRQRDDPRAATIEVKIREQLNLIEIRLKSLLGRLEPDNDHDAWLQRQLVPSVTWRRPVTRTADRSAKDGHAHVTRARSGTSGLGIPLDLAALERCAAGQRAGTGFGYPERRMVTEIQTAARQARQIAEAGLFSVR